MTDRSTEIVFDRANATMSLYLANGCWNVKRELHESPDPLLVSDGYDMHMVDRPTTTVVQVNLEQLLFMLSPDESRTLVGFCQHMIDQSSTHVGYLHTAMGEALGMKDWGAVQTLCEELFATTLMFEQAGATAVAILRNGDVHA